MADWETLPARSTEWETLPARMNPSIASQGMKYEANRENTIMDTMNSREAGIDYASGIPSAAFRAGFSRMSNDAEKAGYLDREVGAGAWGKDRFGAYYLRPEAAAKFGIQTTKPVSIDEQTASRYDIADMAGSAPAIIGSVGGGMAASGLGLLPGLGMAAVGAMGGKAIDETVKNAQGLRQQSAGQIAADIAGEGALSAAGEGVARGLFPIANKLLGPGASRMTPEKTELAKSAQEMGFKIRPGSVTEAPLLARWEGMVRQIFGDFYEGQNRDAAKAGLDRLSTSSGKVFSKEAAGEALSKSIRQSRVKFGEDATKLYSKVDEFVGNAPIIPTATLKQQAQEILDSLPATAEGKIVGGKDAFARDILQMGDAMSVTQAQRLRTMLREASDSPDLIPDVSMHDARLLKKSVEQAFDEAKTQDLSRLGLPPDQATKAVNAMRMADTFYAQGIRKFDLPIVTKITKDASKSGSLNPDEVVDYLIKPARVVRLRNVKEVASKSDWDKVKSAHAQELLQGMVKGTDDPLQFVFDGRAFRDSLDKYGRETLEEVHGKQWTDDAYKYAMSLMLAEKRMKLSGGIVAANVALHPLRNLPKLVWLRGVAKVMEQPGSFKYLTDGIQAGPATKEGAAAMTRFTNQVIALGRDKTGSAYSVTSPEDTR